MSADCGAAPLFEMNWSDGYAVADEALTLIAMLSPNAAVVPLFARSGEIAPFQLRRTLESSSLFQKVSFSVPPHLAPKVGTPGTTLPTVSSPE